VGERGIPDPVVEWPTRMLMAGTLTTVLPSNDAFGWSGPARNRFGMIMTDAALGALICLVAVARGIGVM
jgi:hypothetical protein